MEQVVCIPAGKIPDGLILNTNSKFLDILEDISSSRFLAIRNKSDNSPQALENNTNIRQLIVYLMLYDKNGVYIYQRKSPNGESRLDGGYAFPGGHMNTLSKYFIDDIIYDSLRELSEELKLEADSLAHEVFDIPASLSPELIGVVQTTSAPNESNVQSVHTGIIVGFNIEGQCKVSLKEEGMKNLCQISALNPDYSLNYDKWLRIILPFLGQLCV